MQNLNDLYYFAQAVDFGGFAPAARALGIPKSKISRRVAALEQTLETRLIHRSSRGFTVTEIGQAYYRHCVAMLVEAEAAQEVIDRSRAEPRGSIRLSCPPGLIYFQIAPLVVRFMEQYPAVTIEMDATSRRVDVIKEGFDLALRVRFPPLDDSGLTMKVLSQSPQCLMGSPTLLNQYPTPEGPDDLTQLPSLDFEQPDGQHAWCLDGPDGATVRIHHQPRLVTDDVFTLREAALSGLGVVRMPLIVGGNDLLAERLVSVLPEWRPRGGVFHAVFPSRRGLLPAIRTFLDFLSESLDDVDFPLPEEHR
ncbi:LysR family transcriptional regulator [Tamilnaduibacter salinus]|uniref:LysR family transcriptional regulator n=1 Tax=Tamilnaduibacter salinus TaxID=1484056 RepID=A0A2A2I1U7_9GAMM|nr:LysR substrate-binding domain-containing protein [Tamilnaduibacter salinus]PAV25105.1 LysR family transcriptional regulator [Tamilnaduibacter salinus]